MNVHQNRIDEYLETQEPVCDVCGKKPAHHVIYENRFLCDECDIWEDNNDDKRIAPNQPVHEATQKHD